jgi:hypothetical protein
MAKPKVALSVLLVPEVAPGAADGVQLPPVAQFPALFTFQAALAANAAGVARMAKKTAARISRQTNGKFITLNGF